MRKWVKVLLAILLGVVLLLAAAIFIVSKAIDPRIYQNKIIQAFHEATGREMTISGKFQVSYFPWIGLDVQGLVIGNPQGFSGTDFASIDEVRFKARLLPLLTGKVEISTIGMYGASFHLITAKNGLTNWRDWGDTSAAKDTTSDKQETTLPFRDLAISRFQIKDSSIVIVNQKTREQAKVNHINFTMDNFSLNRPFPVSLAFDLLQKGKVQKTSVDFKTSAAIQLPEQQLRLSDFSMEALVKRPKMPTVPIRLSGDLLFDGKKQFVQVDPLHVKLANMLVDEQLRVTNLAVKPRLAIVSQADNVNLGKLVKTLTNKATVDGRLRFSGKLFASGRSLDEWLRSSSGSGNIAIDNGMVKGIDLSYLLNKAVAYIHKKKSPPAPKKPIATRFSKATASYTINSGVMRNNDFRLLGDGFKASGSGQVDLVKEWVNYRLAVAPLDSKDFDVPVNIDGKLQDPSIKPDWDALAKKYLKGQIQNIFDTKGLNKTLDSLFK